MKMCNFLGISQDYGICDAFLRFQPWVAIGEWPEPRRGDRKNGTGPVRSFVPDGTRFMFAPQPSDKSLGYFRASLRDVESRHAKHVQSPEDYPHAVAPRLLHRLGDLRLPEHLPAGGPHRYRICRRRHRTQRASTRRTPPATFLPEHCHRSPRGWPQTPVRTTPHLVGRGEATAEIEDDCFRHWRVALDCENLSHDGKSKGRSKATETKPSSVGRRGER